MSPQAAEPKASQRSKKAKLPDNHGESSEFLALRSVAGLESAAGPSAAQALLSWPMH